MGLLAGRHPAEHRDRRARLSLHGGDIVADRGPGGGGRHGKRAGQGGGADRRRRDAHRVGGGVLVPADREDGEEAGHGHRRHGGQQQAMPVHHGVAAPTGTRVDTIAGSGNGMSPEVIAC